MAKSLSLQVKAIFIKNFVCSWRNRELITEICLPLIASIIVSLKDQLNFLAVFSPMFLGIAINASGRSLLIHMVEEKNGRFKETQKIMGMRQRAYTAGWIGFGYAKTIMCTLTLILTWALFNLIVNNGDFHITTSFMKLQGVYWIYAFASLNQSLMFSAMFSSPKLASEVTTFIVVLTTLMTFLLFITKLQSSSTFYIMLSIFPTSCISFAYIGAQEANQSFPSLAVHEAYPLSHAATQLTIEAIVYFVLYFYLDSVFPNEYGVAKDPLFFIKDPIAYFKNRNNKVSAEQKSLLDAGVYDGESEQDYSSAIYHQPLKVTKKRTVVIRDLVKRFGGFTAVDRLSLNLYENEILCLLGHNGAGKTTTISVLTGLLDKTEGSVRVQGMDLVKDLDKIREVLGICSQRDVLYDELTVEEQLRFMGQVKGLQGNELDTEIEQILTKTLLAQEKTKITKELSGGNKRKLSLALALIGGSSVIFLDEPTSGMDAMSRRIIWDILERIKGDGRTLVLTTHHLDEAEILADRIAIMAAGKLLACGQSEYIKVNFGEGYQLALSLLDQRISKSEVVEMARKLLSSAQFDPQSNAKTLLYTVPFKGKAQLRDFFRALEAKYGDGVQVSLKMNSLEDAFINIGMDEEKFIQRARKSIARNSDANVNEEISYDASATIEFNEPKHAEEMKALAVPECLSRPPVYSFQQQFLAIFLRKWYTTVRTFSNYVSTVIPFAIIVIGTVIINQVNFGDDVNEDTTRFLKLVFISIFVILAFCFNSSIYIALPVLERETNLKYALNVMGCRVLPYWIGTFAFDYIVYYMFVLLFIAFSYLLELDFLTMYMGKIVFLFSAFGMSYVSFSYLCGVLFYTKSSAAMKTFPLLNFFIVYGLPWDVWGVITFIKQKNDLDFLKYFLYLTEACGLVISPFYAFNLSFQNIAQVVDPNPDKPKPIFISTSATFYGFMLIAEFILYSFLTIFLENRKYQQDQQQRIDPSLAKRSLRVDGAVVQEEDRIAQSTDPIKVQHLHKRYDSGQVAIKDVSYGVQRQQILGLLGPNGAGKSTMFNILTSLIPKTNGSVKIFETEVNRNEAEMFMNVGICPQFDCIWENLTPVEHLYLFGRMKGLSGRDLDESVTYFIQTMQLDEYVNRKAGRLSGGNKRKLCVSNALIGGPCIQFFDEPSTGVDPIARRFLWRTLKQGVQLRQSSVVITTHTMDEAESLCDKIAILVNGQFYCIGSPQELRDKFGEGYNITIKGTPLQMEAKALGLIAQTFPNVRMIEDRHDDTFTVHIPTSEFKFFRAFELMDTELRQAKLLTDFSINQSSLESVFLYFSKQQQNTLEP